MHVAIIARLGMLLPTLEQPYTDPGSAVDIQLLPALTASRTFTPPVAQPLSARRPTMRPAPTPAPVAAAPAPQRDASATPSQAQAAAAGLPSCEREDLILLTQAERIPCRNQLDADKERRANREQWARAARTVEEAKNLAPIDIIPADKRAYYDSVMAARQAVKNAGVPDNRPQNAGGSSVVNASVGWRCSIPFGPNRNKVARPAGIKLGPLPCYVKPPDGPLYDEGPLAAP